jgi:hypothetical protein
MILSLGSLAIANVQILTLKKDQHAYFYAVAATQAFSLAEIFHKYPQYLPSFIRRMNQLNKQLLPHGSVSKSGNTIIVKWLLKNKMESLCFKS